MGFNAVSASRVFISTVTSNDMTNSTMYNMTIILVTLMLDGVVQLLQRIVSVL